MYLPQHSHALPLPLSHPTQTRASREPLASWIWDSYWNSKDSAMFVHIYIDKAALWSWATYEVFSGLDTCSEKHLLCCLCGVCFKSCSSSWNIFPPELQPRHGAVVCSPLSNHLTPPREGLSPNTAWLSSSFLTKLQRRLRSLVQSESCLCYVQTQGESAASVWGCLTKEERAVRVCAWKMEYLN